MALMQLSGFIIPACRPKWVGLSDYHSIAKVAMVWHRIANQDQVLGQKTELKYRQDAFDFQCARSARPPAP